MYSEEIKIKKFFGKFPLQNYENVGYFLNDFGEVFLLYKMVGLPKIIFITGDELDWEFNWIYKNGQAYRSFSLSPDEKVKVNKLYFEYGNSNPTT